MENNETDFTPRSYQIELYENALKENVIIYLPTGAGKTFIAVMLIKALSANIRIPYNEGGKRTVFIVNTVPLVTQQSEYIARLTGLNCAALSGELGIDFWKNVEWNQVLEQHEVLVMTAQILVDAICHGFMSLSRINLIIFDECHRAVNDHPMRQIMQHFEACKKEVPKVLGLSASLLNSNVKLDKIESIVQSLEITFNARVTTANAALKNCCAKPKEEIIQYEVYVIPEVGARLNEILKCLEITIDNVVLKDTLKHLQSSKEFRPKAINKKLISILKCISEQFANTGMYGASKCVLLHLIQLECLRKSSEDVDTAYVLETLITEISRCRKLLEQEMGDKTELEKIHKYSSDQVIKLFMALKDFHATKSSNQKFCCIVFVKRRFTAQVLYHILKNLSEYDDDYKFLHPEFLIGYSNDPYKNSREGLCISKWNSEALHRFRNGLSNIIVATDVIDEGVDIPKCTLVIRYDLPMDVRTYIQSKGRARHVSSKYILLLPRNNIDYLKRYNDFKRTEKYLEELLIGKTDMRDSPTTDEIKEELYHHEIEPYVVLSDDKEPRCITEQTAISVVNIYCTSLLKSKFVYLAPIWELHKKTDGMTTNFQVSLKLPIVSPLKGVIFGKVMQSINLAKRSAAMEMCKELHKIGELSNELVPNTIDSLQKNMNYLFPIWLEEDKSEKVIIGTKKKKRLHPLEHPSALSNGFPISGHTLYLHILKINPDYCMPHDDNRNLIFYNLLNSSANFGIISTKRMPEIPSFQIFMNVGEINVDIIGNHASMSLCDEDIGYMKNFHTLIFSDVVPIIKSFVVFDTYNLDNSFLIVPVDENWDINWELLKKYTSIERLTPSSPFRYKYADYELALVTPNYRAGDTYIVTQICDEITPSSCFPTENFFTYAHYYKEKHDLIINDLNQPLLEVKIISKSIDFSLPRRMHIESKKRRNANLQKNLKEHLVPELCTRINFPALYWLKATTLPTILHRISQLLIAEDLRYTIALEAKLGFLSFANKWPPLLIAEEENEESYESSILDTSNILESTENLQSAEPPINGPEIDVLDTEANHYPWSKHEEPPDLFKNIEDIQLIQIENYCRFMSETNDENYTMKSKSNFINKPMVPVPPVHILSVNDKNGPDPVNIMHALTTKLGRDAFNLERLETLGDSYLKFIVSLFLYNNFPSYNEGPLTALKGRLIGNRNLYYCGRNKHIPGRMKVDAFLPLSNFIAPAYTVERQLQKLLLESQVSPSVLYEIQIPKSEQYIGTFSNTTKCEMQEKILNWEQAETQTGMEQYLSVQAVSDKAVADSVEALIGVYLKSMGIKETVTLLKWFLILPNEIDSNALLFGKLQNPVVTDGDINVFMPWASDIEKRLGYKFRNKGYLLQAFTHPSYTANNMTECYQRLEFLGDAVLDFLITCYIYESCGNLNPGALTDLRSALVNNITFACLTVRHGLHTALLSYSPKLNDIINRFVKFQEERNHVVDDELLWILLEENECNMAEHVDVPKVLGDLFESTIGAIYMDSNRNLTVVWEIIYSIMHKEIDEFSKNIPKQPIRVLYETQGAQPQFLTASFVDKTNAVVMVPLKVTVAGKPKLFHGFGANKKQAKCAAAKQALKSLLKT